MQLNINMKCNICRYSVCHFLLLNNKFMKLVVAKSKLELSEIVDLT